MKQTPNTQYPTPSAQRGVCEKLWVGCWTLDVGRLLPL
jgi:hypothetical protein